MQTADQDPPKSAPRAAARRVAGAVAALFLGGLASALLLEGAVLLLLGEQPRFPRHVVGASFGLRINQPGARYSHHSADVDVEFRINRRGLRAERDINYGKPPGLRRIVSLGDSFTLGYEVDAHQTFSSVLERELRSQGLEVEVLNAGVSGYSSAEECLYLERELLRYEPDLVLVSYFGNDLVDNIRSGLFRLEGTRLLEAAPSYVPGGGLGDWMNTNPLLSLLSERSSAFALFKERLNQFVKREVVESNRRNPQRDPSGAESETLLQRQLAGAIFERIFATTRAREIPLVIQSIPMPDPFHAPRELLEQFPLDSFDVERAGIHFFPARSVLAPHLDSALLYHLRSHGHWTPEAHRLAGEGLAELVVAERLIE